jgi:hypothetical protein
VEHSSQAAEFNEAYGHEYQEQEDQACALHRRGQHASGLQAVHHAYVAPQLVKHQYDERDQE